MSQVRIRSQGGAWVFCNMSMARNQLKTRPRLSHGAEPGLLHQISSLLELLHLQARRQRLLQLFSLLLICDLQCVEESGTAHLELVVVSILLDLDTLGFQEKVLDLFDLPGHLEAKVLSCRSESSNKSL